MLPHSQKKTCLVLMILGVAAMSLVWVLTSNANEGLLNVVELNESQTIFNFSVSFPETIRPRANQTLKKEKVGFQLKNTDYWARKLSNFYDVPDPFSTHVGPDNTTFKDKYIIYRCDNDTMRHCGGWADRVKSMFTVYLLANLTGRVFKAENIMAECDIRTFMVPNHVNWSLPVSFHKKVKGGQQVAILNMFSKTHFYTDFPQTDWVHHPMLKADFVYIKGNHDNADNFREYKLHPESLRWMHDQNRVSVNRVLFKRLFRPSDYLRNKIINFLAENVKSDEKLICAHLRMGKNPSIPEDFRHPIKSAYLTKVWHLFTSLIDGYGNKTKIFLMSDSEAAIAQGKHQDFKDKIFTSPGKIVHVELDSKATAKQKCDGFEKVIFEQQILLHCDSLVITDSGISRMATYLRGRDDGLYCLLTVGGKLLPCKPMDLKTSIYRTIN